ncbi:glycosyltransferase [Ornithinimicrobium cerasi]|uniref:Glycosyltransferase involved in cell wall bisynthesis n=1 Tax=Ornithinimicrobium cerasi TaxID=2248773 RepID=A0A285VFR2_9MICO|nr:glycosyltransferase [Ornithinimicrobium cerasi]SOC52398.1 Glycosyltransferase involved in cell wall bisynthesis [Ornithinimicrobium cerasi]
MTDPTHAVPPTAPRPCDLPQLLVVTPWYPTPDHPYAGTFVRETVRALLPHYDDVLVIHVENVPEEDTREPRWSSTPEGRVLWIPAPMDPMTGRGEVILKQREVLERHAMPWLQHVPVIHCHAGAPTGAALPTLVAPTARLVVTEHASYLSRVLADPVGRDLYGQLLRRADAVTAVSDSTVRLIEEAFPDVIDRVSVVPNPVPLDALPVKTDLTGEVSRWLFVGNLVEPKGVRRLLRTFAAWVASSGDPRATLAIVGDGPLRHELAVLAEEVGVADRVTFAGRVEPDRVGEVYLDHDLLVHLSYMETFGLTCVEAAAVGLPVVATESGGPQNTLAVHAALGLAELVPVSVDEHDVRPVIDALVRLQRSIDPDNLPLSRHHLEQVYGARTVGGLLHLVLSGGDLPQAPVREGLRLLAVAMSVKQARAAEGALANFAAFGGGGVYLTSVPPQHRLPTSVRVVDISGIEQRTLVSRLERLLVLQLPAVALRGAARASRLVGRVAAPAGQRASSLVARAQAKHRSVAHAVRHRGPYAFLWRNVGPWYAARKLELAGTFDSLDLENLDCALLPDEFMTPLVVRALRVNPDLEVRARWPRRAVAHIYADRVLRAGFESPGEDKGVAPESQVDAVDPETAPDDGTQVEDEAVTDLEDNIRS